MSCFKSICRHERYVDGKYRQLTIFNHEPSYLFQTMHPRDSYTIIHFINITTISVATVIESHAKVTDDSYESNAMYSVKMTIS